MTMTNLNETLLDELLSKLESAHAWSPRVISKFEAFIRSADDEALFRVNPLQYAAERGLAEHEAIDLFLHSAKLGLFEMEWHLVCATCGHVVESLRAMHQLHSFYICNQCAFETTATLDDYIQVAFTISRSVREIAFHHPESLSAEALYFKYNLCRDAHSWIDGLSLEEVLRASTKLIAYLEPGEKRRLEFPAGPGVVSISSGQVTVTIENGMDRRACIWAGYFMGEPPRTGITFEPFLSGKKLVTTQTFRNLFRAETLAADEGIGVKAITFLFTDLKGSTALYDQIGDPKAYFLVRQHFDTLGSVINRYEGATVKTIGDAVMATFMTPLDAVRAALEMLRAIEAFNRNIADKLVLKIGIHTGHSIVVTLNDRLDYFGQTVNIAARVQGLADAGEIYVSEDVYAFPGVRAAVAHCSIAPAQVSVKGVSEKLQVYKIADPQLATSLC
jgi:class 3 adenylate cyclase